MVDLLRVGLRVKWAGTKKLTWSELKALVQHSGPDSALARATHGAEAVAWGVEAHLLAAVHDRLDYLNYLVLSVMGEKPDLPEPIKRPGRDAHKPEATWSGVARTIEEMNDLLGWS